MWRNIFVKKRRVALGMTGFYAAGCQSVSESLRGNFCIITWLFMSDWGTLYSKTWKGRTFFVYYWGGGAGVWVWVCVHSPFLDVWEQLRASGYLGDESWGKALGGVGGCRRVKRMELSGWLIMWSSVCVFGWVWIWAWLCVPADLRERVCIVHQSLGCPPICSQPQPFVF